MMPAVQALLIWALVLDGGCAWAQSRNGEPPRQPSPPRQADVVLTNNHPEGSFAIAPEILSRSPSRLVLSVTRVTNSEHTAIQVFVCLSYRAYRADSGAKASAASVKILLGNVGLYPPDRAASFLLRSSSAFRKIQAANPKPTDVQLVLEMKRLHPRAPWTPVEIAIAPPKWESESSR